MNQRFIPATVAALALTLTAVAVPPASATAAGATNENQRADSSPDTPLVTGTAGRVELNGIKQDSGLRVSGENTNVAIKAVDAKGKPVPAEPGDVVDDARPILLTPAKDATGPIRVTVTDRLADKSETHLVQVSITVTIGGSAGTVKPTDAAQPSGLTVSNRDRGTISFSAVDEDGQEVKLTFGTKDDDGAEPILLTPGTNVDGPITLSYEHPALDEPRTHSVGVEGHAAGVDDNDSESITVTGTPGTLTATDEAQDTGLSVANATDDTIVVALDAKNNPLSASIVDGTILVTPGTDATGPITLIVSDEEMADSPRMFTIELEAGDPADKPNPGEKEPADDEPSSSLSSDIGSSEDSDIDWSSIALAGVVAAVIGVIVAVGGQFLPSL